MKKKTGLTRRQLREYQQIIIGNGHIYYFSGKAAGYYKGYTDGRSNGWAALFFAKQWRSRNINIRKLQKVIIASDDARCAYEFARDVPGANIKKIQDMIVNCNDPAIIRKFANIHGADKELLLDALIIAEVLGI